jgi:hypothetical protein
MDFGSLKKKKESTGQTMVPFGFFVPQSEEKSITLGPLASRSLNTGNNSKSEEKSITFLL